MGKTPCACVIARKKRRPLMRDAQRERSCRMETRWRLHRGGKKVQNFQTITEHGDRELKPDRRKSTVPSKNPTFETAKRNDHSFNSGNSGSHYL